MATKRLAKTVIEGARTSWSKYIRAEETAKERRKTRDHIRHISKMGDMDDAPSNPERYRPYDKKSFKDKLEPLRRFVAANAGRPWNDVYSELRSRCDTRTTAGRHIVYDHLLAEVAMPGEDHRFGYGRFSVDEKGILRDNGPYKRWHRRTEGLPIGEIKAWIGPRKIINTGTKLYWGEHVGDSKVAIEIVYDKYWYTRTESPRFTIYNYLSQGDFKFRQTKEFSSNDYSTWGKIHARTQSVLLGRPA